MTMHVNLLEEMEGFIRGEVATGFYGNAREVIRDAVQRRQAEEARGAAWQAAIKVDEDRLIAGQGGAIHPRQHEEAEEEGSSRCCIREEDEC